LEIILISRPGAADFAWFRDQYGDLETYCFTLVQDISPEELLAVLGIEPHLRVVSVDGLRQSAQRERRENDRLLPGVAAVGDWSLMVEVGGFLGAIDDAMRPISVGRTVVSNQRGIAGASDFAWWRDDVLRLRFDHCFADAREGSHPDELLTDLVASGYDVSGNDDPDMDLERQFAAGFALSERITGVHLSADLFASVVFIAGPTRWQAF
jgi:hypothetical protein